MEKAEFHPGGEHHKNNGTPMIYAFPGPYQQGMSLRDWFAGQAPEMPEGWWVAIECEGGHYVEALALWNFYYADAMMLERDKGKGDG